MIGNNSDVLTYISSYTRRRLEKPFGNRPRWVHLPSGVNADNFGVASPQRQVEAKQAFGIAASAPTIVCISRFVPRKGQDKLLRAFPVLRRQFPDVQLILVGRGRSYRRLERLRKKYAPDALLLNNTDYQQNQVRVDDALAAADVFAMPARTRAEDCPWRGSASSIWKRRRVASRWSRAAPAGRRKPSPTRPAW